MSKSKGTKLNHLLVNWPHGAVYVSSWLREHGYPPSLVDRYRRSNWLRSLLPGAVARTGDEVTWEGGLYALHHQLHLPVHLGGRSALRELGLAHYIRSQRERLTLFTTQGTRLPVWFRNYDWKVPVEVVNTNIFKTDIGIQQRNTGSFTVPTASAERAAFEMLYQIKDRETIEEGKLLMQGLTTLRPKLVQKLLTECASIKVRRLFMALAEDLRLPWVKKIDVEEVDFGRGPRTLIKGGRLHPKYRITLPEDLYQGDSF